MGGDRRSIARSAEVRSIIESDPASVPHLVALARDPEKRIFIGPLAESDKWEVGLQIVRALPLFTWSSRQQERVVEIPRANVDHEQIFVRAWSPDSLATLSQRRPALRAAVERGLRRFESSGRPALAARARKIRQRLRDE
jgi:hypothetical protein